LAALLGRLPGFTDRATLDTKVDEALQQALAGFGLDYRRDLKPWLGDQLSLASWPTAADGASRELLVAAVKDRAAAEAALGRLGGEGSTSSTHRGVTVVSAGRVSHAFVAEDLVVLAPTRSEVESAIDAFSGAESSLADAAAFRASRHELPADYLAAAYVDLDALARSAGAQQEVSGVSTGTLALTATDAGLELNGQAPFDAQLASASNRAAVALGNEPPSLTDWMPQQTQAEAVVFGLRRILETAEQQLGVTSGAGDLSGTITQLRALVAFGLGLSIDDDLLPLLDRESAIAINASDGQPSGQLLLRPNDAEAAAQALNRIRDALQQRGARVTTAEAAGVTITSVSLADVGSAAYALSDGVVVIGLDVGAVRAALQAHAERSTLAAGQRYTATFESLGAHGGIELYLDVPAMLSALGGGLDVSSQTRDMLQHVDAVGVTIPTRDDHIEFHAIVTIR
ncbi:MAG TPA: DUF3352 domain-containing protein, partial [Candidatus Limnocylindria bacterium]|nr:DUF3352 domain-containing protein [Candidatus Limnocylindria bacterium]